MKVPLRDTAVELREDEVVKGVADNKKQKQQNITAIESFTKRKGKEAEEKSGTNKEENVKNMKINKKMQEQGAQVTMHRTVQAMAVHQGLKEAENRVRKRKKLDAGGAVHQATRFASILNYDFKN
jgi:hypothetical protein